MTQKELIELGFEREDVSAEESGNKPYYYYSYSLNQFITLITQANDEVIDDNWYVCEEDLSIGTDNYQDLKDFINVFEKVKYFYER